MVDATRNQETDTIVNELERNIFAYWGLCDKIISDNQTSFTSAKIKEIYKRLNITQRTVTPYSPQSNSVEVAHRTMGEIFRAFENEARTDWKSLVPAMNLALNSMVNRITGFSPLFVMTGRPPRLSGRVIFKTTEDEDVTKT